MYFTKICQAFKFRITGVDTSQTYKLKGKGQRKLLVISCLVYSKNSIYSKTVISDVRNALSLVT